MKNNTYYKLAYELNCIGINRLDNGKQEAIIQTFLTIRRLALKHHRLAEMSCNGEGVIRGQFYSTSATRVADGAFIKSAYVDCSQLAHRHNKCEEFTIFEVQSSHVEAKIRALCAKIGFTVEFQGDPRGNTVKLAYKGRYVEIF